MGSPATGAIDVYRRRGIRSSAARITALPCEALGEGRLDIGYSAISSNGARFGL